MLIKKIIFLAFINKNNLVIWNKMITLRVGQAGRRRLVHPNRYEHKKNVRLSRATRYYDTLKNNLHYDESLTHLCKGLSQFGCTYPQYFYLVCHIRSIVLQCLP